MHLHEAEKLMSQGMALLQSRRLDQAIGVFQRAGGEIKQSLIVPSNPNKTCVQRPIMSLWDGGRGQNPQDATKIMDPVDSYLYPFGFQLHDRGTTINREALEESDFSEEQLASCTAALLFNLALCHQLKGYSSNLVCARNLYEQAWACSCRQEVHGDRLSPSDRGARYCLQMAICMNISTCLYNLGDLEAIQTWLSLLHQLIEDCCYHQAQGDQVNFISEEWLRFFQMGTLFRSNCGAAGAA